MDAAAGTGPTESAGAGAGAGSQAPAAGSGSGSRASRRPSSGHRSGRQSSRHKGRRKGPGRKARPTVDKHRKGVLSRVSTAKAPDYKKRSLDGFVCPLEFHTELPTIPSKPKFVAYPFESDRHYKFDYRSTLQSDFKYSLHAEPDVGVPINIIDPAQYKVPQVRPPLHPTDAELVSDKYAKPATAKTRIQPHEVVAKVSWLVAGENMHNDLTDDVYKFVDAKQYEAQRVNDLKRKADTEALKKTKRQRILESFEAMDGGVEHPTNKKLEPVKMWSVLPDDTRFGNQYVRISYDTNPDDSEERKQAGLSMLDYDQQEKRLASALVRVEGETAALLLPDADRPMDDEAEAVRLRKTRFYKPTIAPVPETEQPLYMFTWNDDAAAVHYVRVAARVDMNKQKVTAGPENDVLMGAREPTRQEQRDIQLSRAVLTYEDEAEGKDKIKEEFADVPLDEDEEDEFADAEVGAGAGAGAGAAAGAGAGAGAAAGSGEAADDAEDSDGPAQDEAGGEGGSDGGDDEDGDADMFAGRPSDSEDE